LVCIGIVLILLVIFILKKNLIFNRNLKKLF
jgi:hypothetical protein